MISAAQEAKLRALLAEHLMPEQDEEDEDEDDMPWGEDGAMQAYDNGIRDGEQMGKDELAREILAILGA